MQWLAIIALLVTVAAIYSERAQEILRALQDQIPRVTNVRAGDYEIGLSEATQGKVPAALADEKIDAVEGAVLVELSSTNSSIASYATIERLKRLELVTVSDDDPYVIKPTELGMSAARHIKTLEKPY